MKKATCVYFIDRAARKVLMADQQFKIVGTKGYGGKIENKTPEQSTKDEVDEESGKVKAFRINPDEEGGIEFDIADLEPVGVIDFYNGPEEIVPFGDPSFRVLFYVCETFSGKAIDTKEMRNPQMYDIDNLPKTLVPGDELYIDDLLNKRPLIGYVRRSTDWKQILEYKLDRCLLKDLVL